MPLGQGRTFGQLVAGGSPAALLLLLPNKQAPSAPGVICPPKGQKAGSMGMGAPTSWLEDELPISSHSLQAGQVRLECGAWSLSMPLSGALLDPSLPLAVSRGPPQPPPYPASPLPSLPSRTLLLGPPSSLLWSKASCQVLCGVTSRVPKGQLSGAVRGHQGTCWQVGASPLLGSVPGLLGGPRPPPLTPAGTGELCWSWGF